MGKVINMLIVTVDGMKYNTIHVYIHILLCKGWNMLRN